MSGTALHTLHVTFPLSLTTTLWWSISQLGSVNDLKNLPKVTELFPSTNSTELLNHSAVSLPSQAPKGTTRVWECGLIQPWALAVCLFSEWLFSNSLCVLTWKWNNAVTGLGVYDNLSSMLWGSGTLLSQSCKIRQALSFKKTRLF